MGSLNPNSISPQNESYTIPVNPIEANEFTSLLGTSGTDLGPQYSFGILFNGVELDPVAAEPFPHEGHNSPNANWDWNLEATMVDIGLDCNTAHVQPTGKYHYHGVPKLYLESITSNSNEMLHVGWAADGFPVYARYGFSDSNDLNSQVIELKTSYKLKTEPDMNRPSTLTALVGGPGLGTTNPNTPIPMGAFTQDYEYVEGSGDLDQCNGRYGVTPEFPEGIYYYVCLLYTSPSPRD